MARRMTKAEVDPLVGALIILCLMSLYYLCKYLIKYLIKILYFGYKHTKYYKKKKSNEYDRIVNIIETNKKPLLDCYNATVYIDKYNNVNTDVFTEKMYVFYKTNINSKYYAFNDFLNMLMFHLETLNKDKKKIKKEVYSGEDFEDYIADLLRYNDFSVTKTQQSYDNGVDLIAKKNDVKIAIQCKYYTDNVGNRAVQEIYSGKDYYNCDCGICCCSQADYTKQAKLLAQKLNILLLNEKNVIEKCNNIVRNTIAGKYISSLEFVKNFQILPQLGSNSLYLDNGKILSGKELKNKSKETKSIDFYWEVGNNKFYATYKYTHEDGGAQDNQYIDVQTFLKNAFNNDDKNTYFLAICDGDYYLHKDTQTNCRTRIERLNKICGKTSFAMQINELKEFLSNFYDDKKV